MGWTDFIRLFAEVAVCRLAQDKLEAREGGWLPSVFNAGQAVSIEVYARTQVDIAMHQEPHRSRGESAQAGELPAVRESEVMPILAEDDAGEAA